MHLWYLALVVLVACARPPTASRNGGTGGEDGDGPGPTADTAPSAPDADPAIGCTGSRLAAQSVGADAHNDAPGVIPASRGSSAELDASVREDAIRWRDMTGVYDGYMRRILAMPAITGN